MCKKSRSPSQAPLDMVRVSFFAVQGNHGDIISIFREKKNIKT